MGYPDPKQSPRDPELLTKWAIQKIGVARNSLDEDHPFLAVLTRGLDPIRVSTKTRVMRLHPDNTLLINPLAIVRMQIPALAARLAHVAMHAATRAFSRGIGLDPWRWNVAHDMANDGMLRAENIALAIPELAGAMPGKVSAEQIYGMLPEDSAPHPDWCDLCDCPRPGEAPPPDPNNPQPPPPPPEPPGYCPVCLGEKFIDVEEEEADEPATGPTETWGFGGQYTPMDSEEADAPPTTSIKGGKYGKPTKYTPNIRVPCPHCSGARPPPPQPPVGPPPPPARPLTDDELEEMANDYVAKTEKLAAEWKAAKGSKRKPIPNTSPGPSGPVMRAADRVKLGVKIWDKLSPTAKQYLGQKGGQRTRGQGSGPIFPPRDIEHEKDDDTPPDETEPTTEEQIEDILDRLASYAEQRIRERKKYEAGGSVGRPPMSDDLIEQRLREAAKGLLEKLNRKKAKESGGGSMTRNASLPSGPLTPGDLQQLADHLAHDALERGKRRAEEEEDDAPPPDPGPGPTQPGPEERPVDPVDDDGDGGGGGGDPIELTPEEQLEKEREWLDAIRRGTEEERRRHGGSWGSEGGYGHEKMLAESMPPPDWEAILAQALEGFTYGRPTYARPSRRTGALEEIARSSGRRREDFPAILPGRQIEPSGRLVVVLDTSGSMGKVLIAQFLGSVISAAEQESIEEIRFLQADTRVIDDRVVAPDELQDVHIYGGGGTDFQPALLKLAYEARKAGEKYTVVYLTDLYGPFPTGKSLNRAAAPVGTKGERTLDGRTVAVEVFTLHPDDLTGRQPAELDWLDIIWFVPEFGAAHEAPLGDVVIMGGKKTKRAGGR